MEFVNWVEKQGFDFETETEKAFSKAYKKAVVEELDDDISTSYNAMKKAINQAKKQEIIDKKAEVMSLLSDEIIKRYFYRDGLYEYQLQNNEVIREAVDVLNDEKRYTKILK